MRNRGLGLGLVGAAVLAIGGVARAQQASDGRGNRDDASTVYQLALAEFDRAVRTGDVVMPGAGTPGLQIGQAGQIVVLQGQLVGGPVQIDVDAQWAAAVAATVVARELFAQAAARPHCRFEPPRDEGRAGRLREMAQLVAANGRLHLAERPEFAWRDVQTLLRFSRHLSAPGSFADLVAGLGQERDALGLLHRLLAELPTGGLPRAVLERWQQDLDHHAEQRPTGSVMSAAVADELSELLRLHQPRLRDMHQVLADGYRPDRLRLRVQQLLAPMLMPGRGEPQMTVDAWARIVGEQRQLLQAPADREADIPERAARGMAMLLVHSAERLLEAENDNSYELRWSRDKLQDRLAGR